MAACLHILELLAAILIEFHIERQARNSQTTLSLGIVDYLVAGRFEREAQHFWGNWPLENRGDFDLSRQAVYNLADSSTYRDSESPALDDIPDLVESSVH